MDLDSDRSRLMEEGDMDADMDVLAMPIPGRSNGQTQAPATQPTRSLYAMTRQEVVKGIANRFVHSRTYIFLYLGMAALSVTTVVLSLVDGCPGLAFYVLEIVINSAMILEVGTRLVAFGKQFWKSPFNTIDLMLTLFCVVTLLVILFAGCGATSKEEEVLDTLLLVARNILQFGRLAAVMRKSGRSIFSRPKPIDLRRARHTLDIDMSDDEAEDLGRPLVGNEVVFDAGNEQRPERQEPSRVPTEELDVWLVWDECSLQSCCI